ncbi:MAG TPA: DUF4173 domain-containing protein [Gemmatimonadaceae bacterium]|nr:DUF4173 domain-containing protein [Gemmatimonadaceae bacterium]
MRRSRIAPAIVASAIAIGFIADQLLRAPEWGVNVPLAAALLALAGIANAKEKRPVWPWLASIFFASMWAFRDDEALMAVDILAALSLASLPLLREAGISLRTAGLVETALAPLRSAWATTIGTTGFVQFVRSSRDGETPTRNTQAIAVGLVLAVPVLFVFGTLFANADPVFGSTVRTIFSGPIVSHVFSIGALAWASAGYLWYVAKPAREPRTLFRVPELGGVQVVTPILATVVLFALFIGVQLTSLFGGASFVEHSTGLTYAEYARGGFFELVTASMLVLPIVYFAPAAAKPIDSATATRLRALLTTLLALTGLILASAMWRMRLYVGAFGLTEDRVHAVAVMLWIAATLVVFALTIVRGRTGAAFGSLIAGIVALAALNLMNPKATIAKYNLTHQTGRQIDFTHLAGLGGDAVPILVDNINRVPDTERCRVITEIRHRYVAVRGNWLGWNLARNRAHEAAITLQPAGPCPAPAGS